MAALIEAYLLKLPKAGRIQESRIPLLKLHRRFLDECRAVGIRDPQDYPFNTKWRGYVSLTKYAKRLLSTGSRRAIYIQHGRDGLKKSRVGDGSLRPTEYPYERVECDAHKIDAMFCILVPSLHGDYLPVVVPRLWVIVVQDVVSRAVLGYRLSLNRECDEEDLIKAIQSALSPWRPTDLSGSHLAYRDGAGFPSTLGEEFTGCCWQEFSVDGAQINLSERVRTKLEQFVGANVLRLKRRLPDDRPYVERLFQTLAASFHRLPNTTGTDFTDIRRQAPEIAACKYFIQLEDLKRLLDVLLANYNGTPHSGLAGRTPLEHLTWSVHQTKAKWPLRHVTQSDLLRLRAVRAEVRIVGTKGRTPYVNFCNATYSCAAFAQSAHLVGKKITIECDPDDARVVFAYLPNGEELGPLTAAPPWHRTPHSLQVRRMVKARMRANRWTIEEMDDPVFALIEDSEDRVTKGKTVSSDYLHLRELLMERREEFLAYTEEAYCTPHHEPPMVSNRHSVGPDVQISSPIHTIARDTEGEIIPPTRMAKIWGK